MAKGVRIRKDDNVTVISGKDRGKTGRVIRVEPKKGRVYVENLNILTRHERPRTVKDAQKGGDVGGIIKKEGPIHISNVMLLDPSDNKPTRVRVERSADGKRRRVGARKGTEID